MTVVGTGRYIYLGADDASNARNDIEAAKRRRIPVLLLVAHEAGETRRLN